MYSCSTYGHGHGGSLVRNVGDTDNVVLHLGHHNREYRMVEYDTGWEVVLASDGVAYYTFVRNVEQFWIEVES